jgi:hypothetical protein
MRRSTRSSSIASSIPVRTSRSFGRYDTCSARLDSVAGHGARHRRAFGRLVLPTTQHEPCRRRCRSRDSPGECRRGSFEGAWTGRDVAGLTLRNVWRPVNSAAAAWPTKPRRSAGRSAGRSGQAAAWRTQSCSSAKNGSSRVARRASTPIARLHRTYVGSGATSGASGPRRPIRTSVRTRTSLPTTSTGGLG